MAPNVQRSTSFINFAEFSMQQPTCTNTRIRSTADAHKIFSAIQQGILHMVTRRLDADERQALRSGCIYAWEERGPHTETTGLGIERFTEGRRWSPSRVRDEFLFYYEKYLPPPDLNNPSGKSAEAKPPRDWDPLVKQTYSVWVDTGKGRRKWHLTAYFSQATIDRLSTIDDFPRIRNVVVPERMFKSTRMGKNRMRVEETKSSDVSKAATSRSYGLPTPYPYPNKGSASTAPVFMHEPYQVNHTAEPPTPTTEASPSPVSPHNGQEYPVNQVSYSNQSGSQSFSSSYHRSSISFPNTGPSFCPSKTSDIRNGQRESPSYHPSNASSSWSNENYSNSPPQRLAELGAPSPLSSPLPSAFTLVSQADNAYRYSYSSHTPTLTQSNTSHLYPTSYSMSSALGPPPLPVPESRSEYLSPLLIPDGSQGTASRSHRHQTSPVALLISDGPESFDYSLAPLNDIKRRNRYFREPADENTLRRLRMPQSTHQSTPPQYTR